MTLVHASLLIAGLSLLCLDIVCLESVLGAKTLSHVTVCYQKERDSLHRNIVQRLQRKTADNQDSISSFHHDCDINTDNTVDADEMMSSLEVNKTEKQSDTRLLRAMCVDAVIRMCDEDSDGLLSVSEMKCLQPTFTPPESSCNMESDSYADGQNIRLGCTVCSCACGEWLCSKICTDKDNDRIQPILQLEPELTNQKTIEKMLEGLI